MWLHPATQNNVAILRSRGADFIGPEEGMLACGYEGIGRLWPVELKLWQRPWNIERTRNRIDFHFGRMRPQKKKKIGGDNLISSYSHLNEEGLFNDLLGGRLLLAGAFFATFFAGAFLTIAFFSSLLRRSFLGWH